MNATLTAGLALLGAALGAGAGAAWLALRRRALSSGPKWLVGVACVLAGGALLALLVAPRWSDAWAARRARAELLAIPVYQVIEKFEPAVFDRLLAEYELVVRDRARGEIYTRVANTEISALATQRIAHASDPALLALMHDMLDKLQVLRVRSPDDCYRYLFPKVSGTADLGRWFDRDAQARTLARMADVIRTSAEHPVAVPPRERVEPLLAPLVNEMVAQFGDRTALLSHAEERGVDHATVCAIATTLYEKVMRLPPADAAAVIRSMTQP
jgi:hypothetical protein